MNYLVLKDQVSKLFVYEDGSKARREGYYFGDTLSKSEDLKSEIRDLGFKVEDFYYETAYYFCDELVGYLKNVSYPNDKPDLNTLERMFERIEGDIQPDVYTNDLEEWLNPNRHHYVDEHLKTSDSLFWALTAGQRDQISEIYQIVFKIVLLLGGIE